MQQDRPGRIYRTEDETNIADREPQLASLSPSSLFGFLSSLTAIARQLAYGQVARVASGMSRRSSIN